MYFYSLEHHLFNISALTMLLIVLVVSYSTQILGLMSHEAQMHPVLPQSRSISNSAEVTAAYWNQQAQTSLANKLSSDLNRNFAKNVILFLGDGMSIPTLAATRVYLGGEEVQLSFDKFPFSGLSKTYAIDRQVPDSASTATAYLGGVKGNYGTIGVTGRVKRGDCQIQEDESNHVYSIADQFLQEGRKAGLVTTARVTHASPAGVYAHTANRDWESDTDILSTQADPSVCSDIATQLIFGKTGSGLSVILGGGRKKFLPADSLDDDGKKGSRTDNVNLIQEWLKAKERNQQKAEYVLDRKQLLAVDPSTDTLLGLFDGGHMDYNLDRKPKKQPSLTEMTESAIKVLSKDDKGYFLFVEGAKIDMAHHDNTARKALNDTAEFASAVQRAIDLTNEAETLIVVTSDHSHTLSFSGYPDRGNDILGLAGVASDGRVYSTLNYANGPGYIKDDPDGKRHNMLEDNLDDPEYMYPAVAPLSSETHGGEDVAIFARGPWAHLFSGVNEENVIPHIMAYASCVGDGLTMCQQN